MSEDRKRRRNEPGRGIAKPTRASLHEAALAYLTRGSATGESVRRTLERRTKNWALRAARAAGPGADADAISAETSAVLDLIPSIVERLREVGLVNDAAFAKSCAKRMSSAGRSRRKIVAHLAQKGVASTTVREVVPQDADTDFAAALAFARKRRIGPFAREEPQGDRDARRLSERKSLGVMARAGFDFNACERVLRMNRVDAEKHLRDRYEF